MSSATKLPLQESTQTNKENDRNSERTYKKLESHLLDPTLFQNPTVENIASFLKAEQEKFPNLKRLNAILLDRLREANSKLHSLMLEKEELERRLEDNNLQEQIEQLSLKVSEAEERKKVVEEELEQSQLQVEMHLKELEKAREDFDKISNLFEEQLEENSTLQEEKSDILKQVRQLKDAKKQLEMSIEHLNNQLSSFSSESEKLKQKIQQYQIAFEVRDEALQQISAELREKRHKVHELQVACVEREDRIFQLERAKEELERKSSDWENALKEKQQFCCELHTFVRELETSNSQVIQEKEQALVSSREHFVETLSVDSYSEINEVAEWDDLARLKKIIRVQSELFSNMQQKASELECKLKQLVDRSQAQESKKTVMMSRLLSAIRRLLSFWFSPTRSNSAPLSFVSEKSSEKTQSCCSTHSQ